MRIAGSSALIPVLQRGLMPFLALCVTASMTEGRAQDHRPRDRVAAARAAEPRRIEHAVMGRESATEPRIRVVVRSFETAAISAEINAKITGLPGREGDRFHSGDVLVQFDCNRILAELEAAAASYQAHKAVFENQSQLKRYKATGALAVDQARYEMQKTAAEVRGLEVKRAACVIRAPFDGRVVEKTAQVHEIAQPNQPLIRIVNEARLELVLMVPSSKLAEFKDGTRFTVVIDETGERHVAQIVQSTGLIDAVSQSVRLIAEIVEPSASIVPGMSGTAEFLSVSANR